MAQKITSNNKITSRLLLGMRRTDYLSFANGLKTFIAVSAELVGKLSGNAALLNVAGVTLAGALAVEFK